MSEPFFNTFYLIILLSTHLFCMDVFQEGLNEVVKDDFFFFLIIQFQVEFTSIVSSNHVDIR